jgi:hypothetical protein
MTKEEFMNFKQEKGRRGDFPWIAHTATSIA